MANWTDHGVVATLHDFKWAGSGWGGGFENGAWALQCIERDGKWYMYCPLQGRGIGVLVADNPFGPFTDPIGKPLIGGNYDSIDPAVFIDKDGQAYLCWGNPRYWYVKLNKDMISFDTSIGDKGLVVHDMTIEAFGKRTKDDPQRLTTYEEGPWLYQRNALYYLIFAGGPISEHIGYSTGPSPTGPWKYGGVVLPTQGRSFTDHPGVVDFKGKTYLFYHNGDLPGGDGFHRSVCVDEMKFNPDGSIVPMTMTKEGVAPVVPLNPYQRVEAETIAWESGVKTTSSADAGVYVTGIHDGSYIKVCKVDFTGQGAAKFIASVAGQRMAEQLNCGSTTKTGRSLELLKSNPRVAQTNGRRNLATSAVRKASAIWFCNSPAAAENSLISIGGNLNKSRLTNMKTLLNKIGMLKTASTMATVVASTLGTICHADNPIIQTKFTADPAPMVY